MQSLPTLLIESARPEPFDAIARSPARKLLLAVSSYESRSRSIFNKLQSDHNGIEYAFVGFSDLSTSGARPETDEILKQMGLRVTLCDSEDSNAFLNHVVDVVTTTLNKDESPLEVHVDFSCMPRRWYCSIPGKLAGVLRSCDRAFFWYTPGQYVPGDLPATGVNDLELFSGTASLRSTFRTHVFGLGFERARTQAIWSVMDPQNLVCFYADPAASSGYVQRVRDQNRDILLACQHTLTLPLNDIVKCIARLRDVTLDFLHHGDVILVPDGPKPLILAASLIPLMQPGPGITCFHIRRRRRRPEHAYDVKASGQPVGFSALLQLR
jgi:hypothetical protein